VSLAPQSHRFGFPWIHHKGVLGLNCYMRRQHSPRNPKHRGRGGFKRNDFNI
jgi:hypothetical protein